MKCRIINESRSSVYINNRWSLCSWLPSAHFEPVSKISPYAADHIGRAVPHMAFLCCVKRTSEPILDCNSLIVSWPDVPYVSPIPSNEVDDPLGMDAVQQSLTVPYEADDSPGLDEMLGDVTAQLTSAFEEDGSFDSSEMWGSPVSTPGAAPLEENREFSLAPAPQGEAGFTKTALERQDEIEHRESRGEAPQTALEQRIRAVDRLEYARDVSEDMNSFDPFLPANEEDGKTMAEEGIGLLHYKKWWFRRPIDVHVGGEMLSGTPIAIEKGTMRLVDQSYSYFIPLNKVDFIRTCDGFGDGVK